MFTKSSRIEIKVWKSSETFGMRRKMSECTEIPEKYGRSYFAGLRMTRRPKNVRDVMFFAIFTDKEQIKS